MLHLQLDCWVFTKFFFFPTGSSVLVEWIVKPPRGTASYLDDWKESNIKESSSKVNDPCCLVATAVWVTLRRIISRRQDVSLSIQQCAYEWCRYVIGANRCRGTVVEPCRPTGFFCFCLVDLQRAGASAREQERERERRREIYCRALHSVLLQPAESSRNRLVRL